MKAAMIRLFGAPGVIEIADLPRPVAGTGEVVVRVAAAGVGPWDALTREGKNIVAPPLPLILGSDLSGVVEAVGAEVTSFRVGDEVYGDTNDHFTGAYAEFAVASAGKIARKPKSLDYIAASGVPVVAVTAWQMLFEYAHAAAGQRVLVHGAGGNVGAFAVQLAKHAGLHVIATASASDAEYVRGLGAETVLDFRAGLSENGLQPVDAVIDTVGGEVLERSLRVLGPKGILVSVAAPIPEEIARRYCGRTVFFLVDVSTARLETVGELFDRGVLRALVGTVLPLEQARAAHEMLAGAAHARGKIVLRVAE